MNQIWPENDLEFLDACPVCGSTQSRKRYEELEDNVFGVAPGKWDLYECSGCKSNYLNPRPTQESIIRAYSSYFTHADNAKPGMLSRLKTQFINGARNSILGTNMLPASILGGVFVKFNKKILGSLKAQGRFLTSWDREPGRLLDFGCGNGDFLELAKSAGWNVMGLDFDEKAVERCNSAGLNVHVGGIDKLSSISEKFDVITLRHVLEHLPDPREVLNVLKSSLAPGGWLWIEVPNIEGCGSNLYKEDWLHLDPPRHLIMYSTESLINLLNQNGFDIVEKMPTPYNRIRVSFYRSIGVKTGCNKSISYKPNRLQRVEANKLANHCWKEGIKNTEKSEFITITARLK